jgi:hypothetical protein
MATDYPGLWNTLLGQQGTQNVDIIASIHEDGVNHYLEEHFKNDNASYHRVIKKTFSTQDDQREFTVKLDIELPLQVQFPPYKKPNISNVFLDKRNWHDFRSVHKDPHLAALNNDANKIQIYCNKVDITLTWPKLHPAANEDKTWSFKLETLKIFAEGYAVLNNNQDGYFVSLTPTVIKFDVPGHTDLRAHLIKKIEGLPRPHELMLDECQEKFTDLFVIALNILATEQAPRLIQNVKLPVPMIKDRPVYPALLNISQNCLTVGAGLDKASTMMNLRAELDKQISRLKVKMDEDIAASDSLIKMISKNARVPENLEDLEIKSMDEINKMFVKTNEFVKGLQKNVQKHLDTRLAINPATGMVVNDAFALAIDEYFFDNVLQSVLPSPKDNCTEWVNLEAAKGRACYWIRIFDPDATVNPDGSLTGQVNIDIGGSIEACIRKFWDCSWSWSCSSLALSLKGSPSITIKLLTSDGLRTDASLGGNLELETNLPFPFDLIINAIGALIINFVIAVINIALTLFSFVVIYPDISIPGQATKLYLRNLISFYYGRPGLPGLSGNKIKFIGVKGGLDAGV